MDDPRQAGASDVAGATMGLCALALLAGTPWLVDTSGEVPFYKGPLVFPLISLALMAAASLPAWARLMRGQAARGARGEDRSWLPPRSLWVLVLLCLFPMALLYIGLAAASWVFLLAGFWLAGYRGRWGMLLTATAVAAAIWVTFMLILQIWFPQPLALGWITG